MTTMRIVGDHATDLDTGKAWTRTPLGWLEDLPAEPVRPWVATTIYHDGFEHPADFETYAQALQFGIAQAFAPTAEVDPRRVRVHKAGQ